MIFLHSKFLLGAAILITCPGVGNVYADSDKESYHVPGGERVFALAHNKF